MPGVVDRVPDASAGCHLDLPLLACVPIDDLLCQVAAEPLVPAVHRRAAAGAHKRPGVECRAGRVLAQDIPALHGISRAEPDVPLAGLGGGAARSRRLALTGWQARAPARGR